MALARISNPVDGTTALTAALWNTEFDNIYNNALALISPLTGNLDCNGKTLQNFALQAFAKAGLPAAGTAGRPARVTDDIRGVWLDTSVVWRKLDPYINMMDFVTGGSGTQADPYTGSFQAAFDAIPTTPANQTSHHVHFPRAQYKSTTPITLPDVTVEVSGDGPGTVLRFVGTTGFKQPNNHTTNSLVRDLYILGDSTAGTYAFDTTPTISSQVVAKFKWLNLRIGGFPALFNVPNIQLCAFQDCLFDGSASGTIFRIFPASGSGQAANSNRLLRCQFTGSNVAMFSYSLPTATERMSNWAFRDCDIQFSGTTIPITYPDSFFRLENCEFENSTANNLVKLTFESTSSGADGSFATFIGNQFVGGGAAGNAKVRLEGSGAQQPGFVTFIGNNAGGAAVALVDLDTSTNTPVVLIANQGTVGTNTNGRSVIVLGGNAVATASAKGLMLAETGGGNDPAGIIVDGISGSVSGTRGVLSKNLRGTVTVTDAATTGSVSFPAPRQEPDGTYFLSVTPVSKTGTPAAGSNRVMQPITKTTSGFTITVEVAPGVGNSVTFDWILIR